MWLSKYLTSTIDEFIKKAKLKHDDKYDYSLVDYKNSFNNIKIICNNCKKMFEQIPSNHLKGHGCSNCSNIISNEEKKYLILLNRYIMVKLLKMIEIY